jgi:hypothetical protein
MWLPLIRGWYKTDRRATCVDTSLLVAKGERELPEAHVDSLKSWLRDLPEVDSPINVATDLIELKRYVKGNELCQAIQGRDMRKVIPILEEYTELSTATTRVTLR